MLEAALLLALAAPQESLFDGESLAGWHGNLAHWSVEDGALVGRSTAELPCDRTTYLISDAPAAGDFELTLEYWIDGGNSGVQFRSQAAGEHRVSGPQADLEDGPNWTGGIYEQDGRGVMARRGTRTLCEIDEWMATGLDVVPPESLLKARTWHTYRILARGNTIRLSVDGVLTCELVDNEPEASSSGSFALQLHAGAPMEVRFRNIQLQRFDDGPLDEPRLRPDWIWTRTPAGGTPDARVELMRRFTSRGGLSRADLYATCDNGVEVFLDGQLVAGGEQWWRPFEVELPLMPEGDHELRARCWNEGGPAGFVARLELEYEDGSRDTIVTGDDWSNASGARGVVSIGPLGMAPWGTPSERSSGAPDGILAPSALELAPGFTAEKLLTVPRGLGSWVALDVDDRGRILAAAEAEHGLYRIHLAGDVPHIERLDVDVPCAHGLCAVGSDLYIVVNEWQNRRNGLYRARDADGDDSYEELELLIPLNGGGEHGPHAVALTPDGTRLQIIAGNSTAIPDGVARWRVPPRFHDDQVLPSLPDTFGHGNTMHLHGGWTATCDLDGGDIEVVSTGMRNAFDFAYDRSGNAFTYDSDMEWDIGAPWYRAPRVVHLEPGAEFGWHRGSGKLLADAVETAQPVCETGPASPVGVLHGKDGGFHGPWRERLYIGDWTRGRIYAVEIQQTQGGFTGEPVPFLSGRPFPVTDMSWLPDGSMALAIGGRGRRSGIYRVASAVEHVAEVNEPTAVPASFRTDALASRLALEFNVDIESWAPRAMENSTALLALARVAGEQHRGRLHDALLQWTGAPDRNWLRAASLAVARWGLPDAETAAALEERVAGAQLPPELALSVLRLRTALGSTEVIEPLLVAMGSADTQEAAIACAMILAHCEEGWTPETAETALDLLHDAGLTARGGRSVEGYVARIRDSVSVRLRALAPAWAPPEREVSPRPVMATTFVKEWTVQELAAAHAARAAEASTENARLALGKGAFERAGCFACHRVGNEGGGTGPDLTHTGGRFGVRDLLTAIIEPSRDISDQYRDTEVWTHDGAVIVGRAAERDGPWLTIRTTPATPGGPEGEAVEIHSEDVKLERPSPLSRMPSGGLDGLTEDEIMALIEWLTAER